MNIKIEDYKNIASFVSWRTDFPPLEEKNKEFEYTQLFKYVMPEIEIKRFYFEEQKHSYSEVWNTLVEDCAKENYDLIVFPSVFSIERSMLGMFDRIKQIRALEKPPVLYFVVENFDSLADNFDELIRLEGLMREQAMYEQRRRKELRGFLRTLKVTDEKNNS